MGDGMKSIQTVYDIGLHKYEDRFTFLIGRNELVFLTVKNCLRLRFLNHASTTRTEKNS